MTSQPDLHGAAHAQALRVHRRALWSGVDRSSIMGMELVAGILTWTGIGWLADRWLGTEPWLLGVGAMVGFAAGLYLVWLRSSRMEGYAGPRARSDQSARDADRAPDG